MKNHDTVRSDYCPPEKQTGEDAEKVGKEQLCPAGRWGGPCEGGSI